MGALFLTLLLATAEPTGCAVPNAPPRAIAVAQPEAPGSAVQRNLSGIVRVIVALNERSEVIKTGILSSSNDVFNRDAERTAKETAYRTEIVDCAPHASRYIFAVEYSDRPFGTAPIPRFPAFEPQRFVNGTWSCRADSSTPTREQFLVESDDRIIRTSDLVNETYTREPDGKWRVRSADGIREEVTDPSGIYWRFRGSPDGRLTWTTYTRIDGDTFRRLSDAPPGNSEPYRLETCKRLRA